MKTEHYEVTKNEDGVFSTLSGRLIDIMNPTPEMINIRDIGKGLSHVCRFGGQIDEFYSVAQHSVLVSYLCSPELAVYGLLHDASEAYLGDVIKPLKNILGAVYEDLEAKFMQAICDKYRLDFSLLKKVKQADEDALILEHDFLRCGNEMPFIDNCEKYNLFPEAWDASDAESNFQQRFINLI